MWATRGQPRASDELRSARIRVDDEALTIATGYWPFRRIFRFRSDDVRVTLERATPLSVAVGISRKSLDYPVHILFLTDDYPQLRTELELRGYEVEESRGETS